MAKYAGYRLVGKGFPSSLFQGGATKLPSPILPFYLMDLTPPVAHTLGLLETALRTLGPYSLTDGSVFCLDQAASAPFYQRFVLAKPRPTQLAVWVEVTTDGTSFYLDRSAELPAWSYAWIQEHPAAFQTEICLLFGSHNLVEH